jgi:2-polyprenyl-6-methoxyphenol hydroxylase-like FAD-dependent oxidoreductase
MSLVDGRVLVAGAGIAGLAVARALHQRDIPALVLERLAGPPDVGLAINLPGNAIQALTALGLAGGVTDLGVPIHRREYRNARGRLLFAVNEDEFWGEAATPRCVRRSDLLDLLGRSLPAGTVRQDCMVTSVRPTSQGIEVGLAEAATEGGALMVGADGVHSTVRRAMLGQTVLGTALLSAASWRFMAPNPGVECWTVWSGAQGTFLLIPVDAQEVYGYASATRGGPVDASPEWLRSTFADSPIRYRTSWPRHWPGRSRCTTPRSRRYASGAGAKVGRCSSETQPTLLPQCGHRARRWPLKTPWSWLSCSPLTRTGARSGRHMRDNAGPASRMSRP